MSELEADLEPYHPVLVPPRDVAAQTFGFIIDDECRHDWAVRFHRLSGDPEEFPDPDSQSKDYKFALEEADEDLPGYVYAHVRAIKPYLRQLYPRLIPVRDKQNVRSDKEKFQYMFVLVDSKSVDPDCWPVDTLREVIDDVRKVLRLRDKEQEPAWHYTVFGNSHLF